MAQMMKRRIIWFPQNSLEIVIRAFEAGVVTFGTQRESQKRLEIWTAPAGFGC